MGGLDKPLLTVGGRTMLEIVIAALGMPQVAIAANGDLARFAAFGRAVLPDGPFQGQGPLAGVLAGLDWAANLGMTELLTAPGDMPFLPHGLAAFLTPAPCAVAYGGRRHHLVAAWPVESRRLLRATLESGGSRRVADFAAQVGMRYVDFPLRDGDPFANINTTDDLTAARGHFTGDRL